MRCALLILLVLAACSVVCQDEACFKEHFADCTEASFVAEEIGIQYEYRIDGPKGGGCEVVSRFLTNPNPDWVGPEMRCVHENDRPFDEVFHSLDNCAGPLYDLMTEPTPPSERECDSQRDCDRDHLCFEYECVPMNDATRAYIESAYPESDCGEPCEACAPRGGVGRTFPFAVGKADFSFNLCIECQKDSHCADGYRCDPYRCVPQN